MEYVAPAIIIGLVVLLAWSTRRELRGLKLLRAGRYDEAEAWFRRLANSSSARRRVSALNNLAVTLHRKGDLAGSLEVTNELFDAPLDPIMEAVAKGAHATNLYFLGRDLEGARRMLGESQARLALPLAWGVLALVARDLGDREAAEGFFRGFEGDASNGRPRRRWNVFHVDEADYVRTAGELVRGLWHRESDVDRARGHLVRAANADIPGFYARRAAEVLAEVMSCGGEASPCDEA